MVSGATARKLDMPDPAPLATARIAAFAAETRVPRKVLDRTVPVVVDSLAVMLAGGREPPVLRLASALDEAGAGGVPSFWSKARYRADDAALLFGMASHVLDYDDVLMLVICHPTVPVLVAALAGADRERTGGPDLLEAVAIGTEVTARLGEAMGFRHYGLGFHATATLGTMGATAALARLRGFDAAATGRALAIATSLASGLRVNFGSAVKSLHVGIAAANAVTAVRLAGTGLGGAAEAIEGPSGYLHAFSGGEVTEWPEGVELGRPFAIEAPGFEQKRYPCCYLLHRMIEGTLALRREHGFALADVASARVEVAKGGTSALIHPYPKTGMNALFSAPYAVCAALEDGRIDLSSFTDEAVARPHVQARLHDVRVMERDEAPRRGSDVGSAPVTVTIVPRSGEPVSRTIVASPGSLEDPITPEQLRAKWADCLRRARPGLSGPQADALFDQGLRLADTPSLAPWLDEVACRIGW